LKPFWEKGFKTSKNFPTKKNSNPIGGCANKAYPPLFCAWKVFFSASILAFGANIGLLGKVSPTDGMVLPIAFWATPQVFPPQNAHDVSLRWDNDFGG
jgi:hypothetical protein